MTTFARRWREVVVACPDNVFLVYEAPDESVRRYTYAEFDGIIHRAMVELNRRGVHKSSRVQIFMSNTPQFIAVWLAAVQLGAVTVSIDPRATLSEVERFASVVDPALLVAGIRNASTLDATPPSIPCVVLDEESSEVAWPAAGTPVDNDPDTQSLEPMDLAPEDPAAVLFTSGTTSAPKGALITQANYRFVGDVMAAAASLKPEDRLLVVLPLFHANAQYYSFCAAITAGASVALTSGFSATRFLLQAQRLDATCASLFAAPIRMILARAERPDQPLRLRHIWYAQNISPAHYEDFSRLVGCRPRQLYGMTETLAAVTTSSALSPKVGSMGRQTPGATVALRSPDTGLPVAPGSVGEIVVGGRPGREIFSGYVGGGEPIRDGWFWTGDYAWADDEGDFWFVGRRSDVLKVSGENVSTVEVESVVGDHPLVHEVAVVGRPDPTLDEVPIAYVVPLGGATPTSADLYDWCAQRLAPSKVPREFFLVSELPQTSVGKIKKYQLTQESSLK